MPGLYSLLMYSDPSAALLKVLAESLLRGSIILLLAGLTFWICRYFSAAVRHQILCTAIIGLLMLPAAAILLPAWEIGILPSWPGTAEISATTGFESIVDQTQPAASGDQLTSRTREAPSGSSLRPATTESSAIPWAFRVLTIWAVVGAMILLWQLIGLIHAWSIVCGASLVGRHSWLDVLAEVKQEGYSGPSVRLMTSERVKVPAVFGLRRPTILIPPEALDWSVEQIRVTLLHELAHLQRHDLLTRVLAQFACMVYWPNPLIWLAADRMLVESEKSCDDFVLSRGVKASSYAQHLLEASNKVGLVQLRPTATMAAMAKGTDFKQRMLCVLDPGANRRIPGRASSFLLVCVLIASLLPLAAFRPWTEPVNSATATRLSSSSTNQMPRIQYDGPEIVDGLARALGYMGDNLGAIRSEMVDNLDNPIAKGIGYLAYKPHEERIEELLDAMDREITRRESPQRAMELMHAIVEEHVAVGKSALKISPGGSLKTEIKRAILQMYADMETFAERQLARLERRDQHTDLAEAKYVLYTDLRALMRWAHNVTNRI